MCEKVKTVAVAVAKALRERLDQHNESRKVVQEDLELACDRLRKQVNETEERIGRELEEEIAKESSRLQDALDAIYKNRDCSEQLQEAIKHATTALDIKQSWLIEKGHSKDFTSAINLNTKKEKLADGTVNNKEEAIKALNGRLDEIDENRRSAQEELHTICEGWRKEIDELKEEITSELEGEFKKEDGRLQSVLSGLNESIAPEALQKVKAELAAVKMYSLMENKEATNVHDRVKLVVTKEVALSGSI